jgi:hypothetical protein
LPNRSWTGVIFIKYSFLLGHAISGCIEAIRGQSPSVEDRELSMGSWRLIFFSGTGGKCHGELWENYEDLDRKSHGCPIGKPQAMRW